MKKALLIAVASTTLLMGTASLATNLTNKWDNNTANQAMDKIWLYATPDENAKVVNKVAANARLIPIWQKGEWVKVGNPGNGNVAWVNKEQMFKARNNWYRPDVQTIYIQTTNNSGKPTVNVIAYRNGKKITDKEAQQLYQQIRKEQKWGWNNAQRLSNRMNNEINQDLWAAQQWVNTAWNGGSWDDSAGPWAADADANWGWGGAPVVIISSPWPEARATHTGASGAPKKNTANTNQDW